MDMHHGILHGRIFRIDTEEHVSLWMLIGEELRVFKLDAKRVSVNGDHSVGAISRLAEGALITLGFDGDGEARAITVHHLPDAADYAGDSLRWRNPVHALNRMQLLTYRHRIVLALRTWSDGQGFIETETPLLVRAPSPEVQFDPMRVLVQSSAFKGPEEEAGYLVTSPEFQMKRLLVGGFERIFQISRAFRGNERSSLHNPEFTLLEWYRAHQGLGEITRDMEDFCICLADVIPISVGIPEPPWPRTTVSALLQDHLGICLQGTESSSELLGKARLAGHAQAVEDLPAFSANNNEPQNSTSQKTDAHNYEQVFSRLWNLIEPGLGHEIPLFVHDWPLPLASLARPCPGSPGFADRVECYVKGIELANGFGELTDTVELRRRFERDLLQRKAAGRRQVPLDHSFLKNQAAGLPPCAGMALGIDRLVMWLTGAESLREAVCFDWQER